MKTGFSLIDRSTPYSVDLPLLRRLKLDTYDVPVQTEHFIGEVELPPGSTVSIWVTGYPAQFYRFEVFSAETGMITKFSTGSGSLTEYWPTAEGIADGMIVFESSQPKEVQPTPTPSLQS